jgi:hypothetical protein
MVAVATASRPSVELLGCEGASSVLVRAIADARRGEGRLVFPSNGAAAELVGSRT